MRLAAGCLVVKASPSMQKIWDSILGAVQSNILQCRLRLATAATLFQSCVTQALSRGDGPATRYALRPETANSLKICFDCFKLVVCVSDLSEAAIHIPTFCCSAVFRGKCSTAHVGSFENSCIHFLIVFFLSIIFEVTAVLQHA